MNCFHSKNTLWKKSECAQLFVVAMKTFKRFCYAQKHIGKIILLENFFTQEGERVQISSGKPLIH